MHTQAALFWLLLLPEQLVAQQALLVVTHQVVRRAWVRTESQVEQEALAQSHMLEVLSD
jgi:hypothetical protein